MAYTEIDDPGEYFNTVLWTGSGSDANITGVGFSPNLVFSKGRVATSRSWFTDTVRGATKTLDATQNIAEATQGTGVKAFLSDGFTVGSTGEVNYNGDTFVAWNFKAENAFTNDASSTSIGSIDSAGSVNNDAGFSIVTYTGNDSVATVKHGLSSAPKMMIIKDRTADTTNDWLVYHDAIGNTKSIKLNLTAAAGTDAPAWNNTSPTSSVFTIARNGNINGSSNTIVAYCFAEKQGYSKFGSYKGNGNVDGTFVYTGFKPAWIMTKVTNTTSNWFLHDNKRLGFNASNSTLGSDLTNSESSTNRLDILSNGFKLRNTSGAVNSASNTYIFMAFAEQPFTTSTGVPATAR